MGGGVRVSLLIKRKILRDGCLRESIPYFMQKSLRIFLCLQNNRYLCGVFVIGMHP